MKVLFIGGTGVISSACSALAIEQGIDLFLLNRGQSFRPAPLGARLLQADIHDPQSVRLSLGDQRFDAVVDWIAFTPDQVERDIALFQGITRQYVFISSASAYQTPPAALPVTESTPLSNPYWEYSRNKIACEDALLAAYRQMGFPVTIVRPSHTYDQTMLPARGGYTIIDRMRKGKPVVVHGDGASIWTLTHHRHFAQGFNGLLGNPQAVGQVFHITSDEWLTWDQIYTMIAHAAGCEPDLVHLPSEIIAAYDPEWGASLLGDKAHSMIFDNTKIKRFVPGFDNAFIPFARGVEEIVAWYDADPQRQVINQDFDRLLDRLVLAARSARP